MQTITLKLQKKPINLKYIGLNKMFIDVQISIKIVKFQLDYGALTLLITNKTYEILEKRKLENYKKSLFA